MIQIRLFNELLKREGHIRDLAKRINTSPMNVSRAVKILSKENLVDYRTSGKNKIYFIKKTTESRIYSFISEEYRLLEFLKKYPDIRKIVDAIQKNKKIKLALLFGSYAKGIAKKDSDIDIYIETNDKSIKKEIEIADSKASVKIGVYDKNNLLIKEIEKNHVIIKGAEHYYEKKFFD